MTLGHATDFPSTTEADMQARAFSMLDAAWAGGVRHFDTARSYGRAEAFLADWLDARKLTAAQVTVTSKWGYRYTADWQTRAAVHEVKDHSLTHLDAQWPETRALLGPWVWGYQVHSATLESGVLTDEAVLDRLAELRDAGVRVGLSVTGPRQADIIDTALLLSRGGRRLFDVVQATWNVLEPSAGPALARAHAVGVHTIAKEGVGNGRLTTRGDRPDWLAFAQLHSLSPDTLALAVALRQPFLDVVLSGAATLEQLASNLNANALAQPPDVSAFAETPDAYWQRRGKLEWS